MEGTIDIKALFWMLLFGVIFFVCCGLVMSVFFNSYYRRKKHLEVAQLVKVSLENEKNERTQIASDLHDSVSNDLSAIRNYLVVILKGEQNAERISLFQDLKDGVEAAIDHTREVSYTLMPPLLDKLGFEVAVEDYFNKLNKKSGVCFTKSSKEGKFELNSDVSYELFRVLQEFCANRIHQGKSRNCNFLFLVQDSMAIIEISDDGAPYDFEKAFALATSSGLSLMNLRLKVIGATMLQKPGKKGNHLLIRLPL